MTLPEIPSSIQEWFQISPFVRLGSLNPETLPCPLTHMRISHDGLVIADDYHTPWTEELESITHEMGHFITVKESNCLINNWGFDSKDMTVTAISNELKAFSISFSLLKHYNQEHLFRDPREILESEEDLWKKFHEKNGDAEVLSIPIIDIWEKFYDRTKFVHKFYESQPST